MMEQAIKDFPTQFLYEPEIENDKAWKKFTKFIVCGMGGSGHPADILQIGRPDIDVIVHRDYGLPALPEKELRERLIIASSYSGNTEEPIDSLRQAHERGLSGAAISTGHKLIDLAKEYGFPYCSIPDTGIQPRSATGFSLRAMAKIMGEEVMLKETAALAALNPLVYENEGKSLALMLNNKIPIIYASTKNGAIANNWKIRFNETGKVPAFYSVIPESNHNEINGFDVKTLAEHFYCIFLEDTADHPRISKRMEITKKLYEGRGVLASAQELKGESIWQKIFSSLFIADWTALYTAKNYGADPEEVPMVEGLKKMLG